MRDAGRIGFDIKGTYNSTETYEFLDVVYYQNSSYVAKKETTGNPPADNNEFWQILVRGESAGGDADASDMVIKFEQSANMENILTGEKLSKIFGKLKKWFSVFPSTNLFGRINNLSDFNQINNTYRFWNIGSIDPTYAEELGIERNTGDFHAIVLSYNGDGTNFNFGNIILTSPRLGNDYHLVRMWEKVPYVTYHRANVPSLTNNLLATTPGTALDAAQGKVLSDRIAQLNSDLLDASVGIEIADPTSVHEIWAKISEPQWWRRTSIRKIVMTDANHIILSRNGYWLGTIAVNAGNVTGVLINHWTGEAFTLRASTYNTDSISFTFLSS